LNVPTQNSNGVKNDGQNARVLSRSALKKSTWSAIERGNMEALNRSIAHGLRSGQFTTEDLDFQGYARRDSPFWGVLNTSFNSPPSESIHQAQWWLRAWELAIKTGGLPSALNSCGSPGSSLRKLKELLEVFLPAPKSDHTRFTFQSCPTGHPVAPGVVAVRFEIEASMDWSDARWSRLGPARFPTQGHVIEECAVSACLFAPHNTTDIVQRVRAGPLYVECRQTESLSQNDPDFLNHCCGTFFWARKKEDMDDFESSRARLVDLEEALDGAAGNNDSLSAQLAKGLDPNARHDHHTIPNASLVGVACRHGNSPGLKTLLEGGARIAPSQNMDLDPLTQLIGFSRSHVQATHRDLEKSEAQERFGECLRVLQNCGIDLNAPLPHEHTAVMVAATFPDAWPLAWLIQHGSDPAAPGAAGLSLLDLMAEKKPANPNTPTSSVRLAWLTSRLGKPNKS
jgi:hypothetical protein